jgi:hypothetical protein
MKTKTLKEILDLFLDKYTSDDISDDPEIGELFQTLKRKLDYYGNEWRENYEGRTLRLLTKYLPSLFSNPEPETLNPEP